MAASKKTASKSKSPKAIEPQDEFVEQPIAVADEPQEPKTGPTLSDAASSYLVGLDTDGAGDGTLSSYGAELKVAMKHLGEDTLLADLTTERVREFFESDAVTKTRTGRAKARPTFLKSQRVLRLALVSAQTKGLIAVAPLPATKLQAV